MNKEDIERMVTLQKQFAENFFVLMNPETFTMVVQSGASETAYVLTPQHMKRLSKSFAYNVQQYEDAYGEIKADWQPGIQSPISMNNLNRDK